MPRPLCHPPSSRATCLFLPWQEVLGLKDQLGRKMNHKGSSLGKTKSSKDRRCQAFQQRLLRRCQAENRGLNLKQVSAPSVDDPLFFIWLNSSTVTSRHGTYSHYAPSLHPDRNLKDFFSLLKQLRGLEIKRLK